MELVDSKKLFLQTSKLLCRSNTYSKDFFLGSAVCVAVPTQNRSRETSIRPVPKTSEHALRRLKDVRFFRCLSLPPCPVSCLFFWGSCDVRRYLRHRATRLLTWPAVICQEIYASGFRFRLLLLEPRGVRRRVSGRAEPEQVLPTA